MKPFFAMNAVLLAVFFAIDAGAQSGREEQFCQYGNTIPVAKYYFHEMEPQPGHFVEHEALPSPPRLGANQWPKGLLPILRERI